MPQIATLFAHFRRYCNFVWPPVDSLLSRAFCPSRPEYGEFEDAFEHYNRELFISEGDTLPPCLITMERKAKPVGYFKPMGWHRNGRTLTTDEIALHADPLTRSVEEVLSTLVHEMAHAWQHHFGKSSRAGYHNAEWSRRMVKLGLIPSDTGMEGGKRTGQRMTHYVEAGGNFAASTERLLATGWAIPYTTTYEPDAKTARKVKTKTKYSCPSCDVNVWGKPELEITCNPCDARMIETE